MWSHTTHVTHLDILNDNWKILECTPTLKCISEKTTQAGFQCNPNLRDLLVHSRVSYSPTPTRTTGGVPKPGNICHKTDCPYCSKLNTEGFCHSFVTSHKYIVPSKISCKMNNLVYLLSCTRCGLQNVGETYLTLADRLSQHLRDIRHEANPDTAPPSVKQKGPTTVARHFGRTPHTHEDLSVQILELISKNPELDETDQLCKTREHFWIHRLRTLQPLGINSMHGRKYKQRKKKAINDTTAPLSN